jgi:oxygen-independent coproporphyrinogen-3 oxidase
MSFQRQRSPRIPLRTVYLGGGTPGLMSPRSLESLKAVLEKHFELARVEEFTIECNPENVEKTILQAYRDLGINRVSMGVQSFRAESLKRLERLSTESKIQSALESIDQVFDRWSLDLMMGVPAQSLQDLESELEELQKISPPHFSAYLLSLSDDHKWLKSDKMLKTLPDFDRQSEYFLAMDSWAVSHGYRHYELSNFCRPGAEAIHNSNYWNPDSQYLAFGPGAHGYLYLKSDQRIRFEMERSPKLWLASESGIVWSESLTAMQQEIERLYLDLRVRREISSERILPMLELQRYFEKTGHRCRLRVEAWPLMDQIALQMLPG